MVKMMACMIRETKKETYNGMLEPELADTQFLKVMAETIYYKRTEGGINSCYVWVIFPRDKDQNGNMRFKVIRESDSWKILALKVWYRNCLSSGIGI